MKHLCCVAALAGLLCVRAWAQHPTILTESGRTLGPGILELGIGSEYFIKHTAPELDAPLNQLRLFRLSAHVGVADNVDFSADWRGGLVAHYTGGRRDSDWGDLTISTKIVLLEDRSAPFALAIRSSVKLPNTSYLPHKLGSDATDYFFNALVSKSLGHVELRGSVGFGIIANPKATGNQDDTFVFGAAGVVPLSEGVKAFGEFAGFLSSVRGNNKGVVRTGFSVDALSMAWSMYGSARVLGNNRDFSTAFELSESWGIGFVLMRHFRF